MNERLLFIPLVLATLWCTSAQAVVTARPGDGVQFSVHDMNVVGDEANAIMGDEQGRVCVFCHTPHHAENPLNGGDYMPLWSHRLSDATSYTQYESVTLDAGRRGAMDQLAGPTRLCMSCHDGTVAPDQHFGRIAGPAGNRLFTSDRFPTDSAFQIGIGSGHGLGNDHPIGFSYDDVYDAEMASGARGILPITATTMYRGTSQTVLDKFHGPTHIMTCATCHDVHNKDNFLHTLPVASPYVTPLDTPRNYLLYADQNGSSLCLTCHNK